jgi:putative cell wall-binding protein
MAARRVNSPEDSRSGRRPATTPEAREQQLIAAAIDLAEKQIREGTASAQVVTHYLKLGSSRERLEQAKIAHENELLVTKREAMESAKRVEEMYAEALGAMRSYQTGEPPLEMDPDDDY